MIHIEGNWYISVNGYKDYTLGTYRKKKIIDREAEYLENATYHSSLENALQAYVEVAVSNLLKGENIELVDALNLMHQEYKRLADLFQKVFSEPQVVYIAIPQGQKPKKAEETHSPNRPNNLPSEQETL